MDRFTTEIIQTLAQNGNISEVFRSHLEKAVNTLLAQELTAFLNYEKYDRIGFNSGNSRNGVYERTLHTEYGDLKLEIPRDRNGDFRQQTIAPYKRSNDTLENTVIHLFQKGITMTEIGHHYTPQTVSNMTQAMNDEVEAYHNRQLSHLYSGVYLDATYIPIKRDTVAKEAVYLAIGIRLDGSKECFIKKWQTVYPKLMPIVKGDAILTFYTFPQSIRRSIYSTNLIESMNKQLKKYTKCKEQFTNEAPIERFLARCHMGFNQARAELEAMFAR
ncbi:transposase [Kurthia gibsonii]|uniref:transposase n=1 Tax=Kurthia gibsonii TaxID=33946 RepID=UPI003F25B90A